MGHATIAVSDASFEADVLKSGLPVVVDFWAEWCGPCKALGPTLETVATTLAGKVTIAKMNVDESPMTPGKFGIRSIPTLIIFKGGQAVASKVGGMPAAELQRWIESNL